MSRSEAYYGLSWRLTHLCPVAHPDGHDGPGLVGELVPGIAAVIDDIVVAPEDPIGEPVLTQEAPDVLAGFRRGSALARRQWGTIWFVD